MLTSSNQYLRPEYLTPLPTTLDAKKSPLALLAQTCSAIGADSPNPKLLSSSEKSSKGNSHKSCDSIREKSSPSSSVSNTSANDMPLKSSFKPYESSIRDKTKSPEERSPSGIRVRTPKTSNTPLQNGRCNSNQSASSPRGSPSGIGRKTPAEKCETTTTPRESPVTSKSNESNSISGSLHSPLSASSSKLSNSIESSKELSLGSYKPGSIPVSTSAFLGGFGGSGLHMPMDLMTASALMSPHHQALKAAAMNPYLSYARMKSPAGADPMMSVCRDPYCTGCSLSPHMLGKSSACPAGCTQCDHPVSKAPGFSLPSHPAAAAAYAHAQLAAFAAASQLPYVCNWIAGDAAYCGKRFANSEELLQHLRTHTSALSDSSSLSMLNASGIPPSHPLLHRTYPTPPLSPLATARYHPYGKPPLLPPSLAASMGGMPMPPHPSLAQYFSPYSLYGPRLGAAPGMHP